MQEYKYKNGNYNVIILEDGTKIRKTEDDEFVPMFSECNDVKITDKCSQMCEFCYEGCAPQGKHADLFKYAFLETLHPYTEMALNGNDLDHPDINTFLWFLKKKKVFANITVNQNQFLKNYEKIKDWSKNKMVHGIGISLNNPSIEFIEKVKSIPNTVIHTIVGILSKEDIESVANNDLKILILGYKTTHRGGIYFTHHNNEIEKNKEYLKTNLNNIAEGFKVISFDNLAIEQLNVKGILSDKEWEEFYMGDDGDFTFYIDMVKGEFAKNSVSKERFPIGGKTMDEMFQFIKENNK